MSYIQQYENLKQMLGIKTILTPNHAALNTEKDIYLYNTLSRSKEKFIPIDPDNIRIYSCGPTVYHYVHLGNLRPYIFANILQNTLKTKYNKITHAINITDVGHNTDDGDDGEDKMEKGSRRESKSAIELAKYYAEAFFTDLQLINIPKANFEFPRATDYIKEQIEIVKELEKKGYTYTIADDGVYFDTSKFANYADLAKLDLKNLKEGARVEFKSEKKNVSDFAVWKFSPKNEKRQMEWDSPWGTGFPGWHIECSAMSQEILGTHFDIHSGGIDHIPVHHTNEIAQSECANGEKYVNYWMHVNFLNDKSGKMSKSNDDFLRLKVVQDNNISPLAFKYYIYLTHYRGEINFSFESLRAAEVAFKKLQNFCMQNLNANLSAQAGATHLHSDNSHYYTKFIDALYDDLSTPAAIATIWEMMNDAKVSDSEKLTTILKMDEILGLDLKNAKKETVQIGPELQELLDQRKNAREAKNWQLSDKLRETIENMGYTLKDSGQDQEIVGR